MNIIERDVEGGLIIDSGDDVIGYFWAENEDAAYARDFFRTHGRVIRVLSDGRGNGWVSATSGRALIDAIESGERES